MRSILFVVVTLLLALLLIVPGNSARHRKVGGHHPVVMNPDGSTVGGEVCVHGYESHVVRPQASDRLNVS